MYHIQFHDASAPQALCATTSRPETSFQNQPAAEAPEASTSTARQSRFHPFARPAHHRKLHGRNYLYPIDPDIMNEATSYIRAIKYPSPIVQNIIGEARLLCVQRSASVAFQCLLKICEQIATSHKPSNSRAIIQANYQNALITTIEKMSVWHNISENCSDVELISLFCEPGGKIQCRGDTSKMKFFEMQAGRWQDRSNTKQGNSIRRWGENPFAVAPARHHSIYFKFLSPEPVINLISRNGTVEALSPAHALHEYGHLHKNMIYNQGIPVLNQEFIDGRPLIEMQKRFELLSVNNHYSFSDSASAILSFLRHTMPTFQRCSIGQDIAGSLALYVEYLAPQVDKNHTDKQERKILVGQLRGMNLSLVMTMNIFIQRIYHTEDHMWGATRVAGPHGINPEEKLIYIEPNKVFSFESSGLIISKK